MNIVVEGRVVMRGAVVNRVMIDIEGYGFQSSGCCMGLGKQRRGKADRRQRG